MSFENTKFVPATKGFMAKLITKQIVDLWTECDTVFHNMQGVISVKYMEFKFPISLFEANIFETWKPLSFHFIKTLEDAENKLLLDSEWKTIIQNINVLTH